MNVIICINHLYKVVLYEKQSTRKIFLFIRLIRKI